MQQRNPYDSIFFTAPTCLAGNALFSFLEMYYIPLIDVLHTTNRCHATKIVSIFSFRVFFHLAFFLYITSDIGTVPLLDVQDQASQEREEKEGALKRSTVEESLPTPTAEHNLLIRLPGVIREYTWMYILILKSYGMMTELV